MSKSLKIFISFLTVYLIWGSTYLAIRYAVISIPPFLSMAVRFLVAGGILYFWCFLRLKKHPNKRQWINAIISGTLMLTGGIGSVAWAEQFVTSGVTAMIIAVIPLWFIIFELLLKGKPIPNVIVWIGILMGMIGVAILIGFREFGNLGKLPLWPFIVILVGTVFWTLGTIFNASAEKPDDLYLTVSVQLLGGGLTCTIMSLLMQETNNLDVGQFDWQSILAVLYLITFGSIVVLSAYEYLIRNVDTKLVSTYTYVNPVIAIFLGWAMLNEPVDSKILLSSSLILSGVVLLNYSEVIYKFINKRFFTPLESKQN